MSRDKRSQTNVLKKPLLCQVSIYIRHRAAPSLLLAVKSPRNGPMKHQLQEGNTSQGDN